MDTVSKSNRIHIAIFGKRNAGKSSLVNAITSQNLSLVSDIPGTTTDPVSKSIEILPLGPVVIYDTAGIDDVGELGELRVKKTYDVIKKIDVAIVLYDITIGIDEFDRNIMSILEEKKIPYLLVANKIDKISDYKQDDKVIYVSAFSNKGIDKIKEELGKISPRSILDTRKLVGDLINKGDIVVLVTPIDSAAPKGRIILPQQQVLRDILDHGAIGIVTKETELELTLESLAKKPSLVVTDSQVFEYVKKIVPKNTKLTGFSILFARFKGDLEYLVEGANHIKNLKEGSKILISEACTHHRQQDDIGTVKIPKWLKEKTGLENLNFDYSSGSGFPDNLSDYDLIVHCGACMIGQKEFISRIDEAKNINVPMVNYGVLIAYVTGILERSLEVFK